MLKDNFIESIKSDFRRFVEATEKFVSNSGIGRNYSDILKDGMKVFLKFESSISASLFLLDSQTFDFKHSLSIPERYDQANTELFEELIDKGVIGITLDSRDISMNSDMINGNINRNALTIPIIFNRGIFGILILTLNIQPEKINQFKIQFIRIYAELFTKALENSIITKDLISKESVLEQIIAAKTMDLTQSKHELLAVFNSVQSGILIVDPKNHKITNANYMAKRILGGNEDKILGTHYNNYLPRTEEELLSDEVAFSRNFKSILTTLSGEEIPILRTFSNIYLSNQKLRIESFVDITDQIENEDRLKKANELLELKVQERTEDLSILVLKLKSEIEERKKAENELLKIIEKEKELNDMKTSFVSMVTHEFKTPLTIISNAAQIIKEYKEKLTPDEELKYIDRMLSTIDFISHLLEKVVFIGKSEVEKLSIDPVEFNVNEFFGDTVQDVELIDQTSDRIKLKINSKESLFYTDEKLLRHILINLISNAIKYSEADSEITIYVECNNEILEFSVQDRGIGIPVDEQEKVYDQFFRANNVGNISGTGLGMAIVLRSVELLDGNIEMQSIPEKGTTFKVRLKKFKDHDNEEFDTSS